MWRNISGWDKKYNIILKHVISVYGILHPLPAVNTAIILLHGSADHSFEPLLMNGLMLVDGLLLHTRNRTSNNFPWPANTLVIDAYPISMPSFFANFLAVFIGGTFRFAFLTFKRLCDAIKNRMLLKGNGSIYER